MYFVYLLECADKSIYTGITTDLDRRLKQHRDGTASRFTRAKGARRMIYCDEQPSRGSALKREAQIKKWPRERKLALARERARRQRL